MSPFKTKTRTHINDSTDISMCDDCLVVPHYTKALKIAGILLFMSGKKLTINKSYDEYLSLEWWISSD